MGWGSSTQRSGGRKVRALPRKLVFLGLRREEILPGRPGNFAAGMSLTTGGVQKVCAKQSSCAFFAPKTRTFPEKSGKHPGLETSPALASLEIKIHKIGKRSSRNKRGFHKRGIHEKVKSA